MNECKHCGCEHSLPEGERGCCSRCILRCARCLVEIEEDNLCADCSRPFTERDAFGPGGLAGYQNGRGGAGGTWTGD